MFHSKKGQGIKLSLDAITQLAIALLAIITLGIAFWATTKGNSFEKGLLATDQALITDTLYVSRGNTFFVYPLINLNLLYNFQEDSINVFEKGDIIKLSYNYIPSSNILSKKVLKDLEVNKTEQLQFLKSANVITIGKNLSYNSYKEECSELKSKPIVDKIVIMPKKIDGEKNKLAGVLEIGADIELKDSTPTQFEILIEITENQQQDAIEIYIPFNSMPSKRLACLIANSLMNKEDLIKLNIPIIPSNKPFFRDFDKVAQYRAILSISLGEDFNKISNFLIMSNAFEEYTK